MLRRGKKILDMALSVTGEASTSTADLPQNVVEDEISEQEDNPCDFDSGSSDLYEPNETSNSSTDEETINLIDASNIAEVPIQICPKPEVIKRKRSKKAHREEWKRSIVKKLRVCGQAYTSRSGKEISAKLPRMVDCSKCRYKCDKNFPETQRKNLCKEYWQLGDDRRQKIYLSSLVVNTPVCRRKVIVQKKRSTSREYFLKDVYGTRKRVCRKFMCATLGISHRVVEFCMKKISATGLYTGCDGRSLRQTVYNATPEEKKY